MSTVARSHTALVPGCFAVRSDEIHWTLTPVGGAGRETLSTILARLDGTWIAIYLTSTADVARHAFALEASAIIGDARTSVEARISGTRIRSSTVTRRATFVAVVEAALVVL